MMSLNMINYNYNLIMLFSNGPQDNRNSFSEVKHMNPSKLKIKQGLFLRKINPRKRICNHQIVQKEENTFSSKIKAIKSRNGQIQSRYTSKQINVLDQFGIFTLSKAQRLQPIEADQKQNSNKQNYKMELLKRESGSVLSLLETNQALSQQLAKKEIVLQEITQKYIGLYEKYMDVLERSTLNRSIENPLPNFEDISGISDHLSQVQTQRKEKLLEIKQKLQRIDVSILTGGSS